MRQRDPMPWYIWLIIMLVAGLVAVGIWAILLTVTGHLVIVHHHLRLVR